MQGGSHELHPAVARGLVDGKWSMPHAEAGVAAGFDIAGRPDKAKDEELTQALFRSGKIVMRVEGT